MTRKIALIGAAALMLSTAGAEAQGWGNRSSANASAQALAQSQSSSYSRSSSQGGNASNSNTNTNNYQDRRQAPGIGIPGLTSGALTCLGSVSGGLSVAGFGGGLGATYLERNCESRAVAEQIFRYGYRRQAINLLIAEHPMVRRAFAATPAPKAAPRKR